MNPALHITLTDSTHQFPSLALYQSMSWGRTNRKIQDWLQQREPVLPKMNINTEQLEKVAVYGKDVQTAYKIVQDAEVNRLLSDWIYPDIRLD